MNHIKFKNIILSNDDIQFTFKVDKTDAILGTLCITYIILWRAQFTTRCKELGHKETIIQTFETAKLQSKLLNKDYPTKRMFATIAFKETLLLTGQEYINSNDKQEYLKSSICSILEPGDVKILAKEQINSPEDIVTTRRGVLARLKGNIQAVSMFNASSVIQGKTPGNLSFEEFVEAFISLLCYVLNIEIDEVKKLIIDAKLSFCNQTNDTEENPLLENVVNIESVIDSCRQLIQAILFESGNINLPDGLDFNEPDNLLPMEKGFSLERPLPKKLEKIEIKSDFNDPIISEIIRQQNERSKDTKVSIKPKRANKRKK